MRMNLCVDNRSYSSWTLRGSLLVRRSGLDCEGIVTPLDADETTARIAVARVYAAAVWESPALASLAAEAAAEPWSLDLYA